MTIGSLAFLNPWLLAALAALPVLWWLLRATPPAPIRERFPGVAILLGLEPPEKTPQKTPWWLLALRLLGAALIIFAFAEPVLDPRPKLSGDDAPVTLIMDDGWSAAPDWEARRKAAAEVLAQAERAGRALTIVSAADPTLEESGAARLSPLTPAEARAFLDQAAPKPWGLERAALAKSEWRGDVVWIHDGLDSAGAGDLMKALGGAASLRVIGPALTARGVTAPKPDPAKPGRLVARVIRAESGPPEEARVVAWEAPDGAAPRPVAAATAAFKPGAAEAEAVFEAPLDVLNRVAFFALEQGRGAGGTALLDDRFRRKRVALVNGQREREDQPLLSGAHYLREALAGMAETQNAEIDALTAHEGAALGAFDALALVDVGAFAPDEAKALTAWVEKGGTLIRFAGSATLAASGEGVKAADPLLPVRLRPERRSLGGALSWGDPQKLAPFPPDSLFSGLALPPDVSVRRQALAEPDVDLPPKIQARLADGSPLVTAEKRGDGRILFFHVSADPRWSDLPYSGLFAAMLSRALDQSAALGGPGEGGRLAEALWTPHVLIDGFGLPSPAGDDAKPIAGAIIAKGEAGRAAPPGVYVYESARAALNALPPDAVLKPLPAFPAGAFVETLGARAERPLKASLLVIALALLALDAVATLFVTGRLRQRVAGAAAILFALMAAPESKAQQELSHTENAALIGSFGYVVTGDDRLDGVSRAGLEGLALQISSRTSIEPGEPQGVDVEADELSVYPFLYWPVGPEQAPLSSQAVARLNAYLRQGGMIIFDTRDAHLSLDGRPTPGSEALRRLAKGLDLPPLAPLARPHVLTKSFYLLDEFPGRWEGGDVWVEAPPTEAELEDAETLGFSNDGVSPVIVGGRDWAGAWAINERGGPLLPVSEGGERRREMAIRFGVNIAMYAYAGGYKADQVHIPALLERLGGKAKAP